MSDFLNKIVVLQDGKLTKVGPSDNLEIGGKFTAGELAGDGALVTNIAEANVVGLSSALSTLTSDVATANSNASAAVSTANSAAADASAAVADAAQAATDAAAAAASASSAASDASSAASSASSAASSASTAASDASAAAASALAAQGDASAAASSASAAAGSAASSASDASAAAASASSAQGSASASASSAATAATSASNAEASAFSAQGDASAAAASASSASSLASSAASSASAAESSASSAASSASAAAASAATAASDAASAISTANGAVSTANAAASDAAAAVSTANSAASDASSALTLAQAALPASGGTVSGDLSVTGDLTVQGNIVSKGQVDVIISDSFLDLNSGNVGSSATAGGFTVNVKKATGFTAEEATAFVAGVLSTSAPSMTISGSQLAAGDIVQVSNSAGGNNDGLFVVAGVAGSVVSIKGVGGTMPSAQVPFVQNQFVAGSGETAIVVKVDLAAIAVSNGSLQSASGAIAAGLLCYAYAAGATEGAFEGDWSVLASTASSSLQTAYDNGNGAIDLANGKDFEINGSADGLSDVVLNPHIVIGSAIGQKKQVEANTAAGDIVFLDSDGVCKKASSTSFSEALYVVLEATGGTQALKKVDFLGEIKVGIVGGAPSIKDTLYLSATAGKASKVAPESGSVISLGACVGAAVGGLYPVRLQIGMPVTL